MSNNMGVNHLMSKRISTSFGKGKDFHSKSRKIKDKNIENNLEAINFNQSVDVKSHMIQDKYHMFQRRPSNTINFDT